MARLKPLAGASVNGSVDEAVIGPVAAVPAVANRLVVGDSGPLLALFNRSNRWHSPVMQWLKTNPQASLLTIWPVLTEVCTLLARRLGNDSARDFLRWCQRGGITLDAPSLDVVPDTLEQVLLISERLNDLPFDLTDASVAEVAARRGIAHVLTIDSDIGEYRDGTGKALWHVLRDGW